MVELLAADRIDSSRKYLVISMLSADLTSAQGVRVHISKFATSKISPLDMGSTKQGLPKVSLVLVVPRNKCGGSKYKP